MFHRENRTNIGPYKSRTAMKAANQYIKRKYKINVSIVLKIGNPQLMKFDSEQLYNHIEFNVS